MARLTLARVNPGDDARESARVAGVSFCVRVSSCRGSGGVV